MKRLFGNAPMVVRVTPVNTSVGTFEVSTLSNDSTVAFGPNGEQVDFGYDKRHDAAVWFMQSTFAPGERYTRVSLPAA